MLKKQKSSSVVTNPETAPLISSSPREGEYGGLSPTLRTISTFIDAESGQQIDTSDPQIPETAKSYMHEFLMFSNSGYLVELACFALTLLLGLKYVLNGCVLVGGCTLGVCGSIAWLCLPQLARPFVTNPIIRWFIVTSHSTHITGLLSILTAVVVLSYFSWTNTCLSGNKSIKSLTTSSLALLAVAIMLFFIACYRDERGNGGYIRWLLKLVL